MAAGRGQSTSVYWTAEEYRLLEELAGELGMAMNAITRLALRRLLGLPCPSRLERDVLDRVETRKLVPS